MINLQKHRRAFCLAASLVAAPYPGTAQSPAAPSSPAPQDSTVIYVARRGWHVDIGFAAADLQPPLKSLMDEFPGAKYLFFGFGDRRYLLAKKRGASVLLAALWPGRGMILATGLTSPPTLAFGVRRVAALAVTVRQARDAQAFVWYSLDKRSENDQVRSYATGPYEGSLFFAATPKYSAFHTCNTWVAESLAAAALPIRSAGVIFAGQVWSQVRRLEKKQSVSIKPGSTRTGRLPMRLSSGVLHESRGFRGLQRKNTPPPRADRPYTVPGTPQYWIYDCATDA